MPKQRPSSVIPAARIEAYERLIATVQGIERKGDRMPYTSLNGNMYSFLDEKGRLAIRLSPEDRTMFIDQFDTSLHVAHGRVMQGYVTVPGSMLEDLDRVAPWFAASHAYAATLKSKATTTARRSVAAQINEAGPARG